MDKIKIAVVGAAGRMGQMLCRAILENEQCELSGVIERKGSDYLGKSVSELINGAPHELKFTDDALPVFAKTHAVLDFTSPEATLEFSELSAQARLVHVIGTTGFNDAQLAALKASARHATLIRAGNMSLGVNLLTMLTEKIAQALDENFDIEIVESHHNQKVDAPSGTALMLGDAAAKGRGVSLEDVSDRGRDGITGIRKKGHIGFSAIRGGDIVGEHDVIFAGAGERIILRHIATDRMLFARGAVKAAIWGRQQKPGEYSMLDVLGL